MTTTSTAGQPCALGTPANRRRPAVASVRAADGGSWHSAFYGYNSLPVVHAACKGTMSRLYVEAAKALKDVEGHVKGLKSAAFAEAVENKVRVSLARWFWHRER